MARIRLCRLDELPEAGCRGFSLAGDLHLFAVCRDGAVHLYHNRCPHLGLQLNWAPDRFLDRDRNHILCSAHGALFDIADGYCIAGPCAGQSLTALGHRVEQGAIYLDTT